MNVPASTTARAAPRGITLSAATFRPLPSASSISPEIGIAHLTIDELNDRRTKSVPATIRFIKLRQSLSRSGKPPTPLPTMRGDKHGRNGLPNSVTYSAMLRDPLPIGF